MNIFEYLTRTGKLEAELKLARSCSGRSKRKLAGICRKNPAAGQYLAQAEIWRSHFEESAPVLKALAAKYPAEPELDRTASSVFRSLAYFDPSYTDSACKSKPICWP